MNSFLLRQRIAAVLSLVFIAVGSFAHAFAQSDDLELTVDAGSPTVPLPAIYEPNIDLSGRGFNRDSTWPQTLAAEEAIEAWGKNLGLKHTYRLQYNLWEISQTRDAETRDKLRANYEAVIKKISDAKGTVILNLFGMPAGLGKALDKRSAFRDFKIFKAYVKDIIRDLSCDKKYNIWYEVWNAPDLEDFFLGRQQDYLLMYRAVAEACLELEKETKMHIPVGGPSVSAWFRSDAQGNTVLTPERSLIYSLIKFCYSYHLPLDFITWHGYSSDPDSDRGKTVYKKSPIELIRDWLSYFRFDRNTPLIIDEWNYDRDSNLLAERGENSYIAASFIPSRLEKMHRAGVSHQVYFALEDFENKNEGVVRNVGVFYFLPEVRGYKGGPKSIVNVFRMINSLGDQMYTDDTKDEFCRAISTKTKEGLVIIVNNYIDPDLALDFLSENIAGLNSAQIKSLLDIIRTDKLQKFLDGRYELASLRLTAKVKNLLESARKLHEQSKRLLASNRKVRIKIKNLKGEYLYQLYKVDSSCARDCDFAPAEEKYIPASEIVEEGIDLAPYSVNMIVLKKKPDISQATAMEEALKKEETK
jgi:hypothetical protein